MSIEFAVKVSSVVCQPKDPKLQVALSLCVYHGFAVCVENTTGVYDQASIISNYFILNVRVVSADEYAVLTCDICRIE